MYNFSSRHIKDIILELPHKIGRNCIEYKIEKCGILVGKILASDDFSFIDFENQTLKIDRDKCCLSDKLYYAVNHKEEKIGATLEYLNTSQECIISITDGSTYFFHKNQARIKILKPKTWFKFEHEITDTKDLISFIGPNQSDGLLNGIIHTSNDKLILVMLISLTIIDEFKRTSRETAG